MPDPDAAWLVPPLLELLEPLVLPELDSLPGPSLWLPSLPELLVVPFPELPPLGKVGSR